MEYQYSLESNPVFKHLQEFSFCNAVMRGCSKDLWPGQQTYDCRQPRTDVLKMALISTVFFSTISLKKGIFLCPIAIHNYFALGNKSVHLELLEVKKMVFCMFGDKQDTRRCAA